MPYLNTTSGLSSFFDALTQQLNQQGQNNDQLRGLAAGGIIPVSQAPAPSIMSRLQGMVGLGQPQQPVMPNPGSGNPVPQQMAGGAPSAGPGPAPVTPTTPRSPQGPVPALAPAPSGPLPTFAAAGGAPGQDNISRALAFYQSKGLSPLAASALVGGFQGESGKGLNTVATNVGDGNDGSNSVGIGQWNGPRAQGLRQFAAANNLNPADLDTQLQYSWLELNGPERGTLQALQSAANPVAATAAALGYERPAGWSSQNPFGAKTFGDRLQNTVSLSSNGFNAPFNGAQIGPNTNSFTPDQGGALPAMAASGMGMNLSGATPMSRRGAVAQAAPSASAPVAYADPSPAAAGPATRAIASAAPAGDPLVSVPGYAGQWNKAKIAAAPDGTDVPDDGELAKAQGSAAPIAPPSPPAAQQAPAPAATDLQPARPTAAQIQALIVNPETRQLGLQLWQQTLTGHNFGFLQTGDGAIVRTDPTTGQVVPVYQGQQKLLQGSPGTTFFDPTTRQPVYSVPTQDKTDVARPLTADERAAFGLPAGGAFEMQGGKVMAVPGTYSATGSRSHVVGAGQALVDDQGKQLYANGTGTGASDPDLVESLARRVYMGDTTALTGLSRGAGGSALIGAVQKRVGEIASQYQGKPLPSFAESDVLQNRADQIGEQAGARASGTLNARLDTYAKEASGAMDLAVQQSRNVPRTTWTPVNLAMQAIQRGSNDPALAALVAANNAVVNTYAKAINPNGVPTVSDKTHASEVLSAAQSPEAYEATIAQLQREINIAHNAARGARAAERSGAAAQDMPVTSGSGTAPGSTSQGVFDAVKGLFDGAKAPPVAAPSPAPLPPKAALQDGVTYQTPRGAATWNASSQTFTTVH